MANKHFRRLRGMTLVEVMESILVLSIAVLGASGYRYYSALDVRRADMHTTAARIGMLLCESWRGTGGNESYDPLGHLGSELSIQEDLAPAMLRPVDFTPLGYYEVAVDDTTYYAALSWKDITADIRALNVAVAWSQRDQGETGIRDADKVFRLTTYTQN